MDRLARKMKVIRKYLNKAEEAGRNIPQINPDFAEE